MAWQTPKTNWQAADVVSKDDFNRIEGNIQELQNTKETTEGASQKANTAETNAKNYAGNLVGSLSTLATAAKNNIVAAINEVYNWLSSTASTLTNHLNTNASTSQRGHVQLSTSTTSTSTTLAATASAVNAVRNMIPLVGKELFTSNGTFTVPSGVTRVFLTGCGAGGKGGKGSISGSYPYINIYSGGGGGGGASVIKHPVSVTPGQSISVTIGRGNGNRTTSFGSLLSISGGGNGGAATPDGNNGGVGGDSPSPVLRGSDGQPSNKGRGGGKSCFLGFGGGGTGGTFNYAGQEIPPGDGEDGFLLVEW